MLANFNAVLNVKTSEKLYDLCMIEKLCRGNTLQVKQMVEVFINSIPSAVTEIKEAFNRNDGSAIRKIAHKIKPVLGMYAVITVETEIKEIETLGKEGAITTELGSKIDKLDVVISQVVEQMKATLLQQ